MKTIEGAIGDLTGLWVAIDASDFDAVVAMSPENLRYVTDAPIATHNVIRDRLGLIVWPSGSDPVYVLCEVEEPYMRQESWIQDLRPYKEFVVSPIELLAEVLTELGLAKAQIGAETDYLGAQYHAQLTRELPELRIEPCADLFAHVRMVKTPREREILIDAFRGTEKALLGTYATVQEGESERSMARRLVDATLRSGADAMAFNLINAGPNTGYPHMHPSAYRVKAGRHHQDRRRCLLSRVPLQRRTYRQAGQDDGGGGVVVETAARDPMGDHRHAQAGQQRPPAIRAHH